MVSTKVALGAICGVLIGCFIFCIWLKKCRSQRYKVSRPRISPQTVHNTTNYYYYGAQNCGNVRRDGKGNLSDRQGSYLSIGTTETLDSSESAPAVCCSAFGECALCYPTENVQLVNCNKYQITDIRDYTPVPSIMV